MAVLVKITSISKAFGTNQALKDAELTLQAGSIHALMGENGAGKSTLMKILAGVYQPDTGTIHMDGKPISFDGPRAALDAGISTVFQEHSLLPNLSIAENMFLGREPLGRFGTIDYRHMTRETQKALSELGLDLNPETLVSELTIAERQFVEIAHGIHTDARVMILDEPTAALNAADVEILNRNISRLRDKGVAIVYISHRMEEIFNLCDTVTVLKDGAFVGSRPLKEVTPQSLIAMMVGRELHDLFPPRSTKAGEELLRLVDFVIAEGAEPLSLIVHRGEVVALAGLEGQGQQAIVRALIGDFTARSGSFSFKGNNVKLPLDRESGVRQMQRLGIGFVPEDRKEEGLLLGLPIGQNVVLGLNAQHNAMSYAAASQHIIESTMNSMNIKASSPSVRVGTLSGGNQQKVLLGRYLAMQVDLLLIEEPTRGVDIGAKSEIYGLLRDFTEAGGGILVLSREALELIGLSDRIYVIHDNTLAAEMRASEATETKILDAALKGRSARAKETSYV